MKRLSLVLFFLFAFSSLGEDRINLLHAPVILRGSSFKATYRGVDTFTTNYYTAINDGKADTCWKPMETRGPHFVEMLWNQPVKASEIAWTFRGVAAATLSSWHKGRWTPVASLSGERGRQDFAPDTSGRWRLDLVRTVGTPQVFELGLFGPDQYILPREFQYETGQEVVTLSDVSVPKGPFRPGDTLTVSLTAKASPATTPFGLMLETSDRAAFKSLHHKGADFVSGRWAAKPDANGRAAFQLELPPWTPQGSNDLIVTALLDGSGRELKVPNRILGQIEVVRPDLPEPPPPAHEVAIGENAVGQRGFVVNGEWHPAFFNRFYGNATPERLDATGKNGLKILYWQNRDGFPVEDEKTMADRLDWFDRRIRMALRINPQNYFILSQRCLPSPGWIQSHPEELMRLEGGEKNPCNLVSFGSDLYLRQSEEFVVRLIDFISRQPYAERVIGYHLWACTKYDAFVGGAVPNRKTPDRRDFILGDFHPGAQRLFRDFLREKYGHDTAALRQAWRNDAVTFENALVPRAELVREDIPGSVFRDPVRSRPAIDYLEFFPTLIGRYLRRTAAVIKRESKGKALVLVHYGAVKNFLTYSWAEQLQSNNNDFETLLDDPNIDAFVQAQPYETREAGNALHVYQPVKSIDLHKKLYLFDHDHRTLGAGTLKYGRHRSQYEGESVFLRDYGHQWIDNAGAWISDMSVDLWCKFDEFQLPWFTMPEVIRPIRDSIAALRTLTTPRRQTAEIAVVLSLSSPRYEDANRANPHYKGLVNDLLLQHGFPFLGAPHDVILAGDLRRKETPKYKLYVFLNPTHFSPAERRAIDALKGGGRVLVWFYAPGYATDDGLSLAAVKALSGFDLKARNNAKDVPTLVYQPGSALTEGLVDKTLATSTWGGLDHLAPAVISPVFYTDDPKVAVAGRYSDGTVAYGVRDFGDWKSVWCGVPNFDLPALVNLAKFAGVHLYAEAPVVLHADNRLLMVHNGYEGNREIKISLPKPARVSDLFTDMPFADGTTFTLTLAAPETKLLKLDYR